MTVSLAKLYWSAGSSVVIKLMESLAAAEKREREKKKQVFIGIDCQIPISTS